MPASRAFFTAVDSVKRSAATGWTWRSTMDPGHLTLFHDGQMVGEVSLLPGHVTRRAVLMDAIVAHLNGDHTTDHHNHNNRR